MLFSSSGFAHSIGQIKANQPKIDYRLAIVKSKRCTAQLELRAAKERNQ
jgi:hypothetical protein